MQHGAAAVVFRRVVQQRSNPHVFVSTVVEHDRGHAQKVRQVGNAALLAVLVAMDLRCKQQGVVETYGKRDKRLRGGLALGAWHRRIVRRLSEYRKVGRWRSAD